MSEYIIEDLAHERVMKKKLTEKHGEIDVEHFEVLPSVIHPAGIGRVKFLLGLVPQAKWGELSATDRYRFGLENNLLVEDVSVLNKGFIYTVPSKAWDDALTMAGAFPAPEPVEGEPVVEAPAAVGGDFGVVLPVIQYYRWEQMVVKWPFVADNPMYERRYWRNMALETSTGYFMRSLRVYYAGAHYAPRILRDVFYQL